MTTILALALVASQTTYYEAKVTTFGCTSIDAVSLLQETLNEEKATDEALTKIAESVVNQEAEAA